MATSWEALHAGLARSIRTLQADRAFRVIKSLRGELARFPDAGSLVGYLTSVQGDLDEKDRILTTLVECVQARRAQEERGLATSLLWLGLWPALDAIYRRRLRHFSEGHRELVSSIANAFTNLIERMDRTHTRRTAATLVRSTDREVSTERKQAWRAAMHSVANDDGPADEEAAVDPPHYAPHHTLPPGFSGEEELTAVRKKLADVVGEDAELVFSVLLLGENQREAGERLGLRHDATRKRIQRALVRLRKHFDAAVSRLEDKNAFASKHRRHAGEGPTQSDARVRSPTR